LSTLLGDRQSPISRPIDSQAAAALLMADIAGGDRLAFARLYDSSAGRVYALCRAVIRDDAHAEEVAQEVFLKVWELAGRYDPSRGTVAGWVAMLAHSLAVNRVRSTEAARNRDQKFAVLSHCVGALDEVSDELLRRAEGDQVRTALAQLGELQHEAIVLAFYQYRTHVEMSRILGIPLGTVKSRIHDGLRRLRSSLVAITE
jgi:RNA polymerase sigma-70 factor (ECF subfamily)